MLPPTRFRARLLLGIVLVVVSFESAYAWEEDFHYYVVYLLLRAKGYDTNQCHQIAGFSQYVDDNRHTEPIFQSPTIRAKYHFVGSTNELPTLVGDQDGAKQIAAAFQKYRTDPTRGVFGLGIELHRQADRFAHQGFTAWWNSRLNRRTGSWRPDIGHADAEEVGHQPDLPHLNTTNAIAAARWIYDAIPPMEGAKQTAEWTAIEGRIRAAFETKPANYEVSAKTRIPRIRAIIGEHFGETNVVYKAEEFHKQGIDFRNALDPQ